MKRAELVPWGTGWKLFRVRKNGTLGPLFINRRLVVVPGKWMPAESHPTKGFALRPGWHICSERRAPHLSERGRVWKRVEFLDGTPHQRPEKQGGLWYTASALRVIDDIIPGDPPCQKDTKKCETPSSGKESPTNRPSQRPPGSGIPRTQTDQ